MTNPTTPPPPGARAMSAPKKPDQPKYMEYKFAAQLNTGASYNISLGGPVPSVLIRHIIKILDQAATWLEEDEAAEAIRSLPEMGERDG